MGYLVGSPEGLGQLPLPSPPLPTLPSASASQNGATGRILWAIWNLSCPEALLRVQGWPTALWENDCGFRRSSSGFSRRSVSPRPSSWVSALLVLILLPEDCFLQMLQH